MSPPPDPTLPEIVRFLSAPAAYGVRAGDVEIKETHMSWVFLTGDRVFKLKKPLRTPFLDFSSLSARELFCKEEVRLNKRLAAAVYLRAVSLTVARGGGFAFGGEGKVVEWLVEMRRLPEERMLDRAIEEGTATRQDIDRALEVLFAFFANAAPIDVERSRYLATLQMQHAESAAVLIDKAPELPRKNALDAIDVVQRTLDSPPDWLFEPLENRRIVEGHGDLRPEHICLTDPPAVIDCLEFNRDLRLVDPFDELSYLALECRLLGAAELAADIIPRYSRLTARKSPEALLDFYTAYRAMIRARLAIAHIYDWPGGEAGKWTMRCGAYLEEAQAACLRLRRQEAR